MVVFDCYNFRKTLQIFLKQRKKLNKINVPFVADFELFLSSSVQNARLREEPSPHRSNVALQSKKFFAINEVYNIHKGQI